MTTVTSATMSLDGFVADPDDGIDELFGWYDAGPVEVQTALPDLTFHLHEPSAAYWRAWTDELGALVVGRRLFDLTDGWGGRHPLDVPVVCVTHAVPDGWPREDSTTEFATDVATGVARAREIAGELTVGVAAGQIGRQALDLGLVDEVLLDLVPVVLGRGIPYFGALENGPVRFGDPEVVPAPGVTHLRFRRAGTLGP